MSRIDAPQGLTPSILDRLIDPESEGTGWRRGYRVDQMIDAVRRDLEDLLNTHLPIADLPAEFVELRTSVACYGIPELASYDAAGPRLAQQVARSIEAIVARFEPRLHNARATPIASDEDRRALRLQFQITATLRVEPAPEVAFVTILKLTTGQALVEHDAGRT